MIECPSCKHQDFVGTFFCSECGTRLTHTAMVPEEIMKAQGQNNATSRLGSNGPKLESGAFLGLRVVDSGDVISLLGRDNFTLGRSGKSQAVIPDVDLLPYQAFDHGVSRIHAEIQMRPDGIFLIDLDSANSTLVNGQLLNPQIAYPIHHGDILELGGLKLELISRYRF